MTEPAGSTARATVEPAPVELTNAARPPTPPSTPFWHRGSWGKVLVEVVLITVGVFLALLVDEWRENAEHRQLAEATLRRFRTEFRVNRAAVAAVKDRHVDQLEQLRVFFNAPPTSSPKLPNLATHPAFMEYTAWDLALATQALGYLDPDLAQATAHVYAVQRQLDAATRDATHVMYLQAGNADPLPLTRSLAVYFGDCTLIEPRLLKLYDEILPRLDAALGDRP